MAEAQLNIGEELLDHAVVCGLLGRSCRPASPSARHRLIHVWAVGREMPVSAATWATGRPEWTRATSSRLPKTVSRALRWDTKTSVVRCSLDTSTTPEVFARIRPSGLLTTLVINTISA